jgi:hypothetical protein
MQADASREEKGISRDWRKCFFQTISDSSARYLMLDIWVRIVPFRLSKHLPFTANCNSMNFVSHLFFLLNTSDVVLAHKHRDTFRVALWEI